MDRSLKNLLSSDFLKNLQSEDQSLYQSAASSFTQNESKPMLHKQVDLMQNLQLDLSKSGKKGGHMTDRGSKAQQH